VKAKAKLEKTNAGKFRLQVPAARRYNGTVSISMRHGAKYTLHRVPSIYTVVKKLPPYSHGCSFDQR